MQSDHAYDSIAYCFEDPAEFFSWHLFPSTLTLQAAFLCYQWAHLSWPIPDHIVSTPTDWYESNDNNEKLAKAVAAYLHVPYCSPVRIDRTRMRSPHLSLDEQPTLDPCLSVKNHTNIVNKRLLLIRAEVQTGRALYLTGHALRECGVRSIDVLCLHS